MTVIEMELAELRRRVERLEEAVRRLEGDGHRTEALVLEGLSERDRLLAELRAEGLICDPPPSAHIRAQRWLALPEEEKHAIRGELDHLPPGPMASDIIIESRR